ncbi:pentatricopeptide repeat-containing protein At3g18020 [Salvia miltiorrhiza]|uniref:pentatricopeptide repeat-containing protein At3g18020 n=1 Tax=Salvia miltiorrhiza TaxID=226208 RepID=UPI0025ACE836|nr:pentatricopeptide repeat-containing protein At3g18020 [Salvia miltiorrhiza]
MYLWRIRSGRHFPNLKILASFHSHQIKISSPQPQSQPQHEIPAAEPNEIEIIGVSNTFHWTRCIHKLCTVDGDADAALRLLHQLRRRGFQPDSLNISSIIHALCHARRFEEAHDRFLAFISSNCAPDERTCNVLIARLLDGGDPHRTFGVINALVAEKPEFVPSLVNYNRLIDGLCKLRRLGSAHLMFYQMLMRGHCPTVVSYTTLINGYCAIGDMEAAQKLFDEMSERDVRPNALAYCALLGVVLKRREFEKGKVLIGKIWEVMECTYEVKVNGAAFSNVIDCLCREGLFHEVFNIAEHMPQGNNVREEFAYGQMIDSLCRFERYNGAARIVYIMRKRGFAPSSVSYNSIVHGLCKDGDFLRAFQLLEEGMSHGYSPSEFTYAILVEGLCHQCEVAKANQVLNVMLSKQGVDAARIYNIYLRALCRMNNPSELLNVLVLMLQTNCQPDIISLNTVIKGFCEVGRVEEALQVLNDMITGKFCGPNGVTFTTIMQGLLNAGKAEEALKFLIHVMPEKGLPPGVVTYNAALRGLVKLGRGREVMQVLGHMVCGGVAADCVTHTIIIEGLCELCWIDEAIKFWSKVVWPCGVHDNFVYAALLKGLCGAGRFSEACHLLYELADCGVAVNNVNYNIVIDCGCKLGLKKEAYQIVGEMRKNGMRPDPVTWRILDKLHHAVGTNQLQLI